MPNRLGRYVVQRRIGSGGFATVWLAYDDQLDSPVAVKVLADNWTEDEHVRRRFQEEGRYLRRVESPHVVTVYDAGELEDGRPYLVMTFADQGTLADRLEAARLDSAGGSGGLTTPQSLAVVRQVADGLQALHDRDILHRDVKPANVLFRSVHNGTDVRALVGDLGLGKAMDASSRLSLVAGTPSFVAPEQAAAEPVDARADQYSLAAITYLLLTGRAPFAHANLRAAAEPGPVPTLSGEGRAFAPAVEEVVRRGLAPDREDRYPSVTEFADALAASLLESTGDLPAVTSPGRPWLPINNELTLPGARPTDSPKPPRPREPVTPAELAGATAPAQPSTRPPSTSRRGWRRAALAVVALMVAAGTGYAAYDRGHEAEHGPTRVTLTDAERKVSVTVPVSWDRYRQLSGWRPPIHQPNQPSAYPAVWVGTTDLWNNAGVDASGVFATVIPGDRLPEKLPGHPACTAATPDSRVDNDGHRIVTTLYTACPGGVVIERLSELGDGELLWAQVHTATAKQAYAVLRTVQARDA